MFQNYSLHQKYKKVFCIYVAIGDLASSILDVFQGQTVYFQGYVQVPVLSINFYVLILYRFV